MSTSTSFDGLHTVEFQEETHRYKLDGKRVVGATTVGACYPKGVGLIRWMIAQGLDEYDKQSKLSKAGAIGRIVHKYAECHMKGESFNWGLVDGSDDAAVIRGCIQQYDEWAITHPDDKLVMAEALVASPELMVASQIDLVLTRGDDTIIRDYKTGKKIYASALQQTALYRRMLREWFNIKSNYLEILKFSKEPKTIPFERCIVLPDELCMNGQTIPYKGLLDELEAQSVRNIQTYRHINGVERLLNKYYGY